MRAFCFIVLLPVIFVGVGCRESERQRFFAEWQDLLEQYRTNDIHGADAALGKIESLTRSGGQVVYTTPMSMANEVGSIQVIRAEIHSKLGDEAGATQFMSQALIKLKQAGHTNLTAASAMEYADRFDRQLSPRWRQEK